MDITIFAGKGGVGKSTCAGAYSVRKASEGKVLAIDYDAGHSLDKVLALEKGARFSFNNTNEVVDSGIDNLLVGFVDSHYFLPIAEVKARMEEGDDEWNIQKYLKQFEEDYGLLPLCDMVTTFYGIPTPINDVSNFATLINMYHKARALDVEDMVIDVEPTAGFKRLIESIGSITKSMRNLKDKNWKTKIALMGMPDIKAFTEGEFIRDCDKYAKRIQEVMDEINKSRFYIVGLPEESPVSQMNEVYRMTNFIRGGSVDGFVVNNIRGEPHEAVQIARVKDKYSNHAVIELGHDLRLCGSDQEQRRQALYEAGDEIVTNSKTVSTF